MRSGMVVVDEELLQHGLHMAAAKDQKVIVHLSAGSANPALRERVRHRPREGQLDDLDAFRPEDLVKAAVNFESRSRSRNLGGESSLLHLPGPIPRLLDQLERFALDPTISPERGLSGEAEDQAPELQVRRAAAPRWPIFRSRTRS